MVVASAVHRKQGPMMQKGGFELPLTNFALAVGLLVSGPGDLRIGPRLPKSLTRAAAVGGAILAAGALTQLLTAKPPVVDSDEKQSASSETEDSVPS
jgi:hypothetical protein